MRGKYKTVSFDPYRDSDSTWDSTREDLARAERELRTMERAPGEGRVADEQAWLDACAHKRAWIAKLKAELDA